jgi:hypothetical protein
MFAEPFGVACVTLAFDARGRDDDAEAGGRGAYRNECEDYPIHALTFGCDWRFVAGVQH